MNFHLPVCHLTHPKLGVAKLGIVHTRGAAGKAAQTPQLMQELEAANVEVVVTVS
jgi:hypothetical protein